MAPDTPSQPDLGPVRQFSIFVENKVGRLNELVQSLAAADVHIVALCLVDTTDSTIIRIVVDYPEQAEKVLAEHSFAHDDVPVVAIELQSEAQLKDVTAALLAAEINIHYVYPFLFRPGGRRGLIVRTEAQELAASVLSRHGIIVLGRDDIAR
ncbi:MAG: acetolactate synthase [Verrucomicrobiota bacterium]